MGPQIFHDSGSCFEKASFVLAGTGYLVVFAKSSDEESSLEGI